MRYPLSVILLIALSLLLSPLSQEYAFILLIILLVFLAGYRLSLSPRIAFYYTIAILLVPLTVYIITLALGSSILSAYSFTVTFSSVMTFFGAFPIEFLRYRSLNKPNIKNAFLALNVYYRESSRILGRPLLLMASLFVWASSLVLVPFITYVPYLVTSFALALVIVKRGLDLLKSDVYLFEREVG